MPGPDRLDSTQPFAIGEASARKPRRGLPIIQTRVTNSHPVVDDVLLIVPQNGYYTGFQGLVQTEPLGVEYVAGAVSDLAKNVQIADERARKGGWREKLDSVGQNSVVAIACQYTADVPNVQNLAHQVREVVGNDVPIVVGGHHIGRKPDDMFIKDVDAIVCGPGEIPFQSLVKAWAEKGSFEDVRDIYYKGPSGNFISNVNPADHEIRTNVEYESDYMDNRPEPRRDLVDEFRDEYYFLFYPEPYSVETARGCRYRCSFCSVWEQYDGKYYVEPAKRTVDEIANLTARSGKPSIYVNFVDDLAFSDLNAAEVIAKGLMERGINNRYWAQVRADNVWPKDHTGKRQQHLDVFKQLADAGLDMVLMGLESFDPEELKRVNKGSTVEQNIRAIGYLHELGVKIWGAQIVFPDWDISDFDRAIKTNRELGIEVPQFTILTPLPGTPDYRKAIEEGTLATRNPQDFDFFHSVFKTRLPLKEFYTQIARLYKETGPSAMQEVPDPDMPGKTKRVLARPDMFRREGKSIHDAKMRGLTDKKHVREFVERFQRLQDENTHVAHLGERDGQYQSRMGQNAILQAGADNL